MNWFQSLCCPRTAKHAAASRRHEKLNWRHLEFWTKSKEFRFKIISMCSSSSSFDIHRCPIKYLWKVRAETISYRRGFEARIFLLSALLPPKPHLYPPEEQDVGGCRKTYLFCNIPLASWASGFGLCLSLHPISHVAVSSGEDFLHRG